MPGIDELDCKILYKLGENARLSYKQIAKEIKSKKEVVAYRVNQLVERGVITKFVPVFSLSKIGIFSGKIYINLQGMSKEQEKNLYADLAQDRKIAWIAKCVGKWDLLLGIYYEDILDFGKIKEQILQDYGFAIGKYEISFIEDGLVFNRDYLIDRETSYRKEFVYGGDRHDVKLTLLHKRIITLIKNNGRYSTVDLANELKLDSRTVLKNIKELEKEKVLQGFTVFINLEKIEMQLHKLCISLNNYSKKEVEELIYNIKSNDKVIHLIKSTGSWEIEVEIEEARINYIHEYIRELKNNFPKTIKQIDLVTITEEIKLDFFPEEHG